MALEEEMRQFQKDKEIEQLYKKHIEIDKKKKKLSGELTIGSVYNLFVIFWQRQG